MTSSEGPGSSLAFYCQSSTADTPGKPAICPSRSNYVVVGLRSGRIFPARCQRLRCPVCIQVEARNYAAAIALAAPDRAVLLTAVGDEWPVVQRRMNRLREYRRRGGAAGEWVWHVEQNPSGTGHHVHAWQWGPQPLSTEDVRTASVRAGLGHVVNVESVRAAVGRDTGVLLGRGAMAYGMKSVLVSHSGADLTAEQEHFLRMNGNRLGHASRGFWRDEDGQPAGGRRPAVRAALRRPDGDGDGWAVMTREAARSTLSARPLPTSRAELERSPTAPAA